MATILEYNSKTFTGTGESGATLAKGLLKGPKPDKNEIHDKRTNGGTKAENSAKAVKMHIHGDVIQSSLVGRHVQTETLEFRGKIASCENSKKAKNRPLNAEASGEEADITVDENVQETIICASLTTTSICFGSAT